VIQRGQAHFTAEVGLEWASDAAEKCDSPHQEPAMNAVRTRSEVLDREFLEMRAGILQIAAALDRIERADGSPESDARLRQVRVGLELLLCEGEDRAERVQLAFSRPYDEAWLQTLKMPK
jgi:hypothetical protein